jgi:CO/xanthine dehydrogenase Mo-binding subunit
MPEQDKALILQRVPPFFYSDLNIPNMLCAKIFRSQCDSGIIESISAELPQGVFLFTAKDIPGSMHIETLGTRTELFASQKISYNGEPLGIIVGESEEILEETAQKIAVIVKDDSSESGGTPQKILEKIIKSQDAQNEEHKNAESIFEIEGTYTISHSSSIVTEPGGCLAYYADGKLSVCCPTEWKSHLRENLCAVLNMSAANIELINSSVTSRNSMCVWYSTVLACQTALASMLTGHPVKLMLSRNEHTRFMENSMSCVITHKSAVKEDGSLLSMNVEILADVGSANPFAKEILNRLVVSAAGIYRPKRLSINATILSSSSPPAQVSLPWVDFHCFFAAENHLHSIVSRAAASSIETRKFNSVSPQAQKNAHPFYFDLKNSGALLDMIASMSDFERKYSVYEMQSKNRKQGRQQFFSEPIRGIGIASAFIPGTFYGTMLSGAEQELEVTMEKNGSVTINTFQPSQTIKGIWKATASKLLDVPVEQISIQSDFAPGREPALPEQAYANVSVMTQLLKRCCEAVQKLRFREPLPIKIKRSVSRSQKRAWDNEKFSGQPFHSVSSAAAVVEIELEPFTLRETIRGIWLAIDGGEILAAKQAETTLKRTIQDLLSSFIRNDAISIEASKISISFLQSTENPRQIGDAVYTVLPAAFANALSQSASFPVRTLPIETNTIFRLITERSTLEGDAT